MPTGRIHLVSDVHLEDGKPETWEEFFAYLDGPARDCSELFLLGDVFHAWIGDDDGRELAERSREKLRALVRSGAAVRFVFGNHDFMVGKRFARETGVVLSGESATAEAGGMKALLLHGDTLCTGDVGYQKARARVLRPHFLLYARLLPRRTRIARAEQMLGGSDPSGFVAKDVRVDEKLACELLESSGADVMVHGHTHEPGEFALPCGKVRWSLPDWQEGEGGWLELGEEGFAKKGPWAG